MTKFDRTRCCGWIVGIGLAVTSAVANADQMTRPATGVTRIVFNTPGDLTIKH